MISKPIINLLRQFDEIIIKLKKDKNSNQLLEKIAGDIRLLELWRKEIESEKQSIFIIGKTSTGKSEFHNLLLDVDYKDEFIFKTSTKVETGVIQSLQHCKNKDDARAEISVRNIEEFDKLAYKNIPGLIRRNNVYIIPLKTVKDISFLRDQVMAKCDDANSYSVIKAVDVINIHFPLKYFKNFILIDTPGLGSHESTTDSVVRSYFHGKSHILWLLNTSKRTLSDCISLMKDEKALLNHSLEKIVFIGNKFDLIEVDENERHINLKDELITTLNKELGKIIVNSKIHKDLLFTSFKKPNKKFGDSTSHDELKKLEEKFLLDRKITSFNNVDSFVAALVDVLKSIKDSTVFAEENISKSIISCELENKKFYKNIEIFKQKIFEVKQLNTRVKNEILNIPKDSSLNTRERYHKYLDLFNSVINETGKKFDNYIRANLRELPNDEALIKLKSFIKFEDFTLERGENLWNYYVSDEKLYKQRERLSQYVVKKIDLLTSIEEIIIATINLHLQTILKKISLEKENIRNIKSNKIHLNNDVKNISQAINSIKNINILLKEDIELNISKWIPINITNSVTEIDILENFLKLNSLLDEHTTISNRINNK